jgi:hypothetical protein
MEEAAMMGARKSGLRSKRARKSGLRSKRGRKSGLPSRVPGVFGGRRKGGGSYGLPRLDQINVANEKVLDALKRAGWSAPNSDGFSEVVSELDLNNDIRWVVQSYLFDKAAGVSPKTFRSEIQRFKKSIDTIVKQTNAFIEKIPPVYSAVAWAILQKWQRQLGENLDSEVCDEKPDPEYLWEHRFEIERAKSNITELGQIVDQLIEEEAGGGRDANRAEHRLIDGLAEIFERWTGKVPTRDSDPQSKFESSSPFHSFVEAVDELLPAFRLLDIDNLIRHRLERTGYPPKRHECG